MQPQSLFAEGEHEPVSARAVSLNKFPREARPWVYWFWFNGNVTSEGIKADLQAMADIGIGGAMLLNVAKGAKGPVRFLTPEWQDLMKLTISEAARLGMEIDANNCDGWSDAGGPWVPPEHSMQKLVWTETTVHGGKPFDGKLQQPKTTRGFYRDISVFALPLKPGQGEALPRPRITVKAGAPSTITHEYPAPVIARGADVNVYAPRPTLSVPVVWQLQVSDDGVNFRTVYDFDNRWRFTRQSIPRVVPSVVHFAPVQARFFRLVAPFMTTAAPDEEAVVDNQGLTRRVEFRLLPEARVSLWQHKAGHLNNVATALEPASEFPNGWADAFAEKPQSATEKDVLDSVFPVGDVIDLTTNMNDGVLAWTPAPGDWTVVRLGHTSTGGQNHTGSEGGIGLNLDMFSKEALDAHFPHVLGKILENSKQFGGTTLTTFHSDSWEAGVQNWTQNFPQEFATRCGYSMMPYLPVLAGGRIIGSAEISDRFLFDFRRTIADLIGENFWGHQAALAHQHGIQFSGEGAGRQQFMKDGLLYLGKADLPMGEFWIGEGDTRPDCPASRAVANAMGKKMVLAEAYTSAIYSGYPQAGQWQDHPFSLKPLGDRAFCRGVNKFVFHRSASQPSVTDLPGLAWGTNARDGIGINMERTNTWWHPGAAWISYLSRCQQQLQGGRCVVDVCVLASEDVPNFTLKPEGLPQGHLYDGLHAQLLRELTVDRGEIVTAKGMRYSVMSLPQSCKVTVGSMREVVRLAKAGATIAGPMPLASPSLRDRGAGDAEMRSLISELKASRRFFETIQGALAAIRLQPDFVYNGEAEVLSIHRRTPDTDIYFVSNQTGKAAAIDANFRIAGRAPDIFDPDSGLLRETPLFTANSARTTVPLSLDPYGSLFVIFRRSLARSIARVQGDATIANELVPAATTVSIVAEGKNGIVLTGGAPGKWTFYDDRARKFAVTLQSPKVQALPGPWAMSFAGLGDPAPRTLDILASWSESADPKVKYFSGTATYQITFNVSAQDIAGRAVLLDLGKVAVIAEIAINGKTVATKWKPPFRADVSEAVRAGANTLTVKVTNLWPNRLIGDEHLPPAERLTRTNYHPYTADSPLFESGLIGPVTLSFADKRRISWKDFS